MNPDVRLDVQRIVILLLFKLIYNIDYESVINSIKKHLIKNIDNNGVHISMNPSYQAEYINNLFEIKNMLLFFQKEVSEEIEFQIINMTSSLIKFFHKDNSLAFLNGSNIGIEFSNYSAAF